MTFDKILDDLVSKRITCEDAYNEMSAKDKMKTINYYSHFNDISLEPLKDNQLQELNTIVTILQILDNESTGSPIDDNRYDNLVETLVTMGIPRINGNIEINDATKVSHKFTCLRGTLDKVYYLTPDEKRTNKSRKYLDDWIKSTEALYFKKCDKRIDLNAVKILVQPKFDGASACKEDRETKPIWITRGDTKNNKASDISHIMTAFDKDWYKPDDPCGEKFEIMCSEESKNLINSLLKTNGYRNSRQVVTATLNSNEPDFKVEYLCPIPLRIVRDGEDIEQIHPKLIETLPTVICTFGDRDIIRKFANEHKYVEYNGQRLRTDGAVLTILDENIKRVLGRDNDINNFEVAYKFTEEIAYSKVKDIEFYVSEFGFITPVVVINDLIMKGNTVNHISISNYERFKELQLHYGDEVKVSYDIIPYLTIDENCRRIPNGRLIQFVDKCPMCGEPLDLGDNVMIQCTNPECPSILVGRVLNYCRNLRIKNIGYNTLDTLYAVGLLKNGIRSLYKLRKKAAEIEDLEGFGKIKTKKIIREIESKRKLNDYEFFGSISIEGISITTFKTIFSDIPLEQFINMINQKNFELLHAKLIKINGIGGAKADIIINYMKDKRSREELQKLLDEVNLIQSYRENKTVLPRIVFTGCRPTVDITNALMKAGYDATDNWNNKAVALVVPNMTFESSKVSNATRLGIPIIEFGSAEQILNKLKP